MLRLMGGAVRQLAPNTLARLQQLYEKAIRVAILRE
jgi:hypothetical protein